MKNWDEASLRGWRCRKGAECAESSVSWPSGGPSLLGHLFPVSPLLHTVCGVQSGRCAANGLLGQESFPQKTGLPIGTESRVRSRTLGTISEAQLFNLSR